MHVRRPELYEPINENFESSEDSEDVCYFSAAQQGLKPKLKKFQQNIYWDVIYKETAVFDYVEAFRTGFQFDTYSFARECFEHTSLSLDRLHEFHITMIRKKGWNGPFQKAAQSLAVNYNNAWFYCYQFGYDFNQTFH